MKKLSLKLPHGQMDSRSEIWIGHHLPRQIKRLRLGGRNQMGRAFLVIDLVLKHSASAWWEGLRAAGWQVEIRWVRATEALKSLSSLEPIYHWLIQKGADRQSVIFAIGGGTVGDAVGFVAGTYLRGVRWVSVPTTLLAQVDSGLGGKTAVNHSQGKNLIGVFHQPVAVLCDSEFLRTLPTREFISGWGEIIKYGIALDGSLFRFLATHSQRMVHEIFEDPGVAEYLVSTCLKLKKVAVEKDELDQNGVRAILNFGHTLGHVFEAETGYGYFRHGEAVIWGMRGAVRLSVLRGLLSEKKGIELDQFLSSFKIPPLPTGRSFSSRLRLLKNDKKSTSGVLKFVLLQGIGKSVVDQAISPEEIREALRWLSQKKGVKN